MEVEYGVLVIEDDLFFQLSIKHMLKNTNFNLLGILDNKIEFLEILEKNIGKINLVICDLMIHGEYLDKAFFFNIKRMGIPVIVITATLEEERFKELESVASTYLIKPFHKFTLQSAAINAIKNNVSEKYKDLLEEKFLFIRNKGNSMLKLNFSNISHLMSSGNYCYIVSDTAKFIEKISLSKILKEKLDARFIRVHHKYAVNSQFIKAANSKEVELINGEKFQISNTFRANLKEFIKK